MGDRTAERFSVEENTTLLRREIEASRFCNARDHALLPRDLQPSEDRDPTLDFDQDPDFLPEEDIGREDNLVQVGSHQQDRGKESNIRTFPMQSEITDLGLRPEGGLVRQRHSTEKIKHNGNEAETEEKKDDGSHFKPDDHFRLFRNDDEGKSNEVTDEIAETAGDFVQNIRGDVDVRMDSHDEAHLQHLAALVPGLCLTGSLHNRYTAVDGDDCVPEDSTSSAADEIASNVEPPLTHKRYSIYEKMTQARKLLKSEPNEVDEEGCNVSRKSTDTVARLSLVDDSDSSLRVTRVKRDAASVITMDDNSGIPEAEGPRSSLPGAAQNETNPKGWNHDDSIKASLNAVELADEDTEGYKSAKSVSNVKVQNEENSKGGKNANSAAASPDVVDLIGDMQDANSYAAAIPTEMYVLSLEGRDKKVKVQRAPPMNSSKPANGHLKNHTADAPDIFDLVTHEEEFVESEEAQAPSTGAAQVIIDLLSFDDLSMEGQALIQTIVEDKHATEEPDIFEETDEEDSHSEFETLKQAKEDPEDAGETDAETGDETAEEESANGIETNKVATGDHEAAEDTDEDTDKEKSTVIVATKKKAAEEPATDNKATEEPEVVKETNEEKVNAKIEANNEEGSKGPKEDDTETYSGYQDYAEHPDSDDNPESDYDEKESDLSAMAFDLGREFSGIVQTLSKEFTDLMPGKKSSEGKSKSNTRDVPDVPDDVSGSDEANEESQRLAVKDAVLAIKPSRGKKIYVNWDRLKISGSSRSKAANFYGSHDHEVHVESDLSSLTAGPLNETPAVDRRSTNFYLANRRSLVADDDEEVVEKKVFRRRHNWFMCCF